MSGPTPTAAVLRYGLAAAVIAASVLLRLLLDPVLGDRFVFTTLFPAVLFAAWYGGLGPGLAATAMGAAASWGYLFEPRDGLLVGTTQQVGLVLFVVVGVGISLLGGAMRRKVMELDAALAVLREDRKSLGLQVRVLESMSEGVSLADGDGVILYTNPAEDRMFGIAPGASVGRNLAERFDGPESEYRRLTAEVAAALDSGGVWSGELRNRRADGTTFVTAARITALEVGGRRFRVCVQEDVTERRRAEAALRESEATLRAFYDSAPVCMGVVETTGDGDILHLYDNPATCAYFGVPPGATIGKRAAADLGVPAVVVANWIDHYRQAARTGSPVRFDHASPMPGGKRLLSVSVARLDTSAGDGPRYCYVAEDVTELRAREEELVRADRRKDEFLGLLAHELRNPLAPLRTAIELVRVSPPDVALRACETAERQVQTLTRLVDDLLDVSRLSRGKIDLRPERADLRDVAARALETSQPGITDAGIALTLAVAERPVLVAADVVRLSQAVANLLNNAAKFTPPGGRVTLTVAEEGGRAVVRVADTGVGIEPDKLPSIFELFVQAEPAGSRVTGGLGIGLTVARGLAEMHGGTLRAASDGRGGGSTFELSLPLCAAGPSPAESAGGEPRETTSGPRRILVVDDNADAADTISLLLVGYGHEVRVAYDAPEALALAEADPPDIAILDIGLPGMSGYELAERFRLSPTLRGVRLAALTGWGQEQDRRRSAEAGFEEHLVKPVEPDVLRRLIAGW